MLMKYVNLKKISNNSFNSRTFKNQNWSFSSQKILAKNKNFDLIFLCFVFILFKNIFRNINDNNSVLRIIKFKALPKLFDSSSPCTFSKFYSYSSRAVSCPYHSDSRIDRLCKHSPLNLKLSTCSNFLSK
jgi:hypothetical protein